MLNTELVILSILQTLCAAYLYLLYIVFAP